MSFKEWFRQWDQGGFDLCAETAKPTKRREEPAPAGTVTADVDRARLERRAVRFDRRYNASAVLLLLVMTAFLAVSVLDFPAFGAAESPTNNEVTERYIGKGMEETGAVNIVAGVILDYRAFDTLGESHVLYCALTAVLVMLLAGEDEPGAGGELRDAERKLSADPLLQTTARILVPPVILFGCYIILNGHLGPGGGFSGGAVIGAGLILYALAFGFEPLGKLLNARSFPVITLCALGFYSLAKCYSFFCGANGLDSHIAAGTPGRIFSAGLILPLNCAVGLVVACTVYGIYSVFKRGKI